LPIALSPTMRRVGPRERMYFRSRAPLKRSCSVRVWRRAAPQRACDELVHGPEGRPHCSFPQEKRRSICASSLLFFSSTKLGVMRPLWWHIGISTSRGSMLTCPGTLYHLSKGNMKQSDPTELISFPFVWRFSLESDWSKEPPSCICSTFTMLHYQASACRRHFLL
jgi:hypothetical protein